jgi:hypothetical protein
MEVYSRKIQGDGGSIHKFPGPIDTIKSGGLMQKPGFSKNDNFQIGRS